MPDETHGEDAPVFAPPGHFYSPIPSLADVRARAEELFDASVLEVPDVDLDRAGQLEVLEVLHRHYVEEPRRWPRTAGPRYRPGNSEFGTGDAFVLRTFLRELRPRRVVEVGAGHSTCVMLDAADELDEPFELTSIEPYPDRLLGAIGDGDLDRFTLLRRPVQDVDAAVFEALGDGDVLFIDSSHVAKIGSDVNRLVFEVLPRLASGVYVHIHDLLFPFEYPEAWVLEGRAWNEAYVVRAFLQNNDAYRVRFWADYLIRDGELAVWMEREMPAFKRDTGSSLWLQKR